MFDYRGYYLVAEYLEGAAADQPEPNLQQAFLRAALGRIYYAAFGEARKWAKAQGFQGGASFAHESLSPPQETRSKTSAAIHGNLQHFLAQYGSEDVALLLRKLRILRNQADYEEEAYPLATLRHYLAEAKQSYAILQEFLSRRTL